MTLKYHLSKRQLKELQRGNILRLAIPMPPQAPADLRGYVRCVLDAPTSLLEVRAGTVVVDAGNKSDGLAGLYGNIRHDHDAIAPLVVQAILADLGDVGGRLPLLAQWPGSLTTDRGVRLPRAQP